MREGLDEDCITSPTSGGCCTTEHGTREGRAPEVSPVDCLGIRCGRLRRLIGHEIARQLLPGRTSRTTTRATSDREHTAYGIRPESTTTPPVRDEVVLVEPRGLEPLTPCLQSRCATNCAMAPSGECGLRPAWTLRRLRPAPVPG